MRCSAGGRGPGFRKALRHAVVARPFALGFLDPGRECLVADHAHRDRHEGVILAAQLRALAVVDAFARRLEPGLVDPARDGVDLDAERGHREGVDYFVTDGEHPYSLV